MPYSEALDPEGKYHLHVENGVVCITRFGEEWLVNPEGAKAWIDVADKLEKQRLYQEDQDRYIAKLNQNIYLTLENRPLPLPTHTETGEPVAYFSSVVAKLAEATGLHPQETAIILAEALAEAPASE